MELKLVGYINNYEKDYAFNRTRMELKQEMALETYRKARAAFNRTRMELKLNGTLFCWISFPAFNRTRMELKRRR